MINNLNLTLLNGGRYRCTPHWNDMLVKNEQCYKLYMPVEGGAAVTLAGKEERLKTGYLYFISGLDLDDQNCEDTMDLYWIHFLPDSLKLRYLLEKTIAFYRWPIDEISWIIPFFLQLNKLFENSRHPEDMILKQSATATLCRIHGIINYLLADILSPEGLVLNEHEIPIFQRFSQSLDYMDRNFFMSPSLADVARQSHLAPNYFHRIFKEQFKITPYTYMLNRRMDYAKQLLLGTSLSIKEVAAQSGYDNEFHFSTNFKKYTKITPSKYRKFSFQG